MSFEEPPELAGASELIARIGSIEKIEKFCGVDLERNLVRRGKSDPLSVIYEYWKKLGGASRPLDLADLAPMNVPPRALPHLTLVDVKGKPERRRYFYRLVGTEVEAIFGGHYTGHYMDQIVPSDLYPLVRRAYDRVVETAEPVLFSGHYVREDGSVSDVSRIAMPMIDEGEAVSLILCGVFRDNYMPLA